MTEKCTKPEKFTKSFAKESTNTLNDTEEHDRNQHMSDILTYQQPPRFQRRRPKRDPRPPTTDQPEEMEATQDTQVNTKNITPNTRSTTGVTRLILLLTLILVFAACAVCFCDHRFSPETNWPNQWQTETHRSENKSEQIKETSYQLRLCNLKNKKLKPLRSTRCVVSTADFPTKQTGPNNGKRILTEMRASLRKSKKHLTECGYAIRKTKQ